MLKNILHANNTMEIGDVQQPEATTPTPAATGGATTGSGQIYVKSLQGNTISIDFRDNLTVSEIKNHIHSELQIPVDQQRLIYQGKQLEDGQTLADYGIGVNSTIHVVLRVKGGC